MNQTISYTTDTKVKDFGFLFYLFIIDPPSLKKPPILDTSKEAVIITRYTCNGIFDSQPAIFVDSFRSDTIYVV